MTRPRLEHVGSHRESRRQLYVLELDDPDSLPPQLQATGQFSVVLIVWDATGVPGEIIGRFARRLIDAGGVYFCTWGPGCEWVHDCIDAEWVGDGLDIETDATVMTTWHADEPLAEAVWFALFTADPIDRYFDDCRSVIAVCVACPEWASEVRSAFGDVQAFSDEVLGADEEDPA